MYPPLSVAFHYPTWSKTLIFRCFVVTLHYPLTVPKHLALTLNLVPKLPPDVAYSLFSISGRLHIHAGWILSPPKLVPPLIIHTSVSSFCSSHLSFSFFFISIFIVIVNTPHFALLKFYFVLITCKVSTMAFYTTILVKQNFSLSHVSIQTYMFSYSHVLNFNKPKSYGNLLCNHLKVA